VRPSRSTLSAICLAVIAIAAPALGVVDAESAVVPVTVEGCEGVEEDLVRATVTLEMRVMGAGGGAIGWTGWPAVRVTCTGEQARIELRSTADAATSERILDLSGFPVQARARLLAVEISVLLTPAVEHAPPPMPQVSPHVAPPVPAPPLARPIVELGASVQRLGRPQVFGAGLDLALRWPVRSRFSLLADLRATTASWAAAPGTVRARDFSLGVGGLFGGVWRRMGWGVGPGLRAGYVWLQWQRAFGGTWWGPTGTAMVAFVLSPRWWAGARVEAGYVVRAVDGALDPQGMQVISLSGPWVSAALTVGLAF
jgi:hypothetical protein